MNSIPDEGVSPEYLSPEPAAEQLTAGLLAARQLRQVVDIEEAARQLELAAHDVRVASSCIGLGDLDRAHTSTITARAAIDAAETILRVALAAAPAT